VWGVYDNPDAPREVHVAPVDEEHVMGDSCDCGQRIEIGDEYFLVIHEAR